MPGSVFDSRVGNYPPSTASNHDSGKGGWYIAQGLNEVAKAIVEAAKILADKKELR